VDCLLTGYFAANVETAFCFDPAAYQPNCSIIYSNDQVENPSNCIFAEGGDSIAFTSKGMAECDRYIIYSIDNIFY